MKHLSRFLIGLISLGAISLPAFGQSASSKSAFARGCEQMMHKNFANAISSFTEAISDDPNDVNSYFRRGQSFFCVANYKDAIVDFDRALAKGALDFNVYLWKGTAYAKLDKDDLAVFNYEKAMRLHHTLVDIYKSSNPNATSINSAVLADGKKTESSSSTLSFGSNQRALDTYKVAARIVAENESGYFRSGTTYSGLLNLSGNIVPLSGFSGQPDWLETSQNGHPYLKLKDPGRDVRELDAQIVLHPQDATLHFQRARAFQQLGKSKETLSDLSRAIELDATNPNYFLARAFYYHGLNDENAAEAEIRRAQEVDPVVPSDLSFEVPAEKKRDGKS